MSKSSISVNSLAMPLVSQLIAKVDLLRILKIKLPNGCILIDAGINCIGSFEAGCRIAEICMGGLGDVKIGMNTSENSVKTQVEVRTSQPVISCLGSQYAGWLLNYKNGEKFQSLGSGPARAIAHKEKLFEQIQYEDKYDHSCLVLETSKIPPKGLANYISEACNLAPDKLVLIVTPTGSLAGVVQIAARVVEVAMHKAHALEFPVHSVIEGMGSAPVSPPVKDSLVAMGRTNDAILYGGTVSFLVDCNDDDAEQLANNLPSSNSRDYGTPFADKFKEYEYDFSLIDPMLFSPAKITVTTLSSGRTYSAGFVNQELLEKSFAGSS